MLKVNPSDKYEIVTYRSEFKSQLAGLQTHLWGPDLDLNAAYLEWKYEQNPYLEVPLIAVALCGGQVVGMIGMFGAKWQLGRPRQRLPVPCSADLVVHPDHRNRGLFTKLMMTAMNDLANRGYTHVFSLSANRGAYLGFLMRGWRSVGPLGASHWPARRGALSGRMRRVARRLPWLASAYRWMRRVVRRPRLFAPAKRRGPFDALDSNGARTRSYVGRHVSVEQRPRPKAMAELVARIGGDGRIRHVRDWQYFAWRFENPLSLYRFLFWEGTKLEGYLVLQTSAYAGESAWVNIVDWEATDSQVGADLLQAAIHWGDFDDLNIWSGTLSDEAKKLLRNAGFKVLDETKWKTRDVTRPTVLVRPIHQEMLEADWVLADLQLLDLANWDLRGIYSDGL